MTNPICAVCADDATAVKLSLLMIAGVEDGRAMQFFGTLTLFNPLCAMTIEQVAGRRGTRRRFCDEKCRLTRWVLKKAAMLLAPLEQARVWEILLKLSREA
jgi:hypothetical protein